MAGKERSVNLFKRQRQMLEELREKMLFPKSVLIRVAIEQFYKKMKERNFEI